MLSDEEKKAIESLIEIREFANLSSYKDTKISQLNAIDVVLNLIEKQSKEIEKLKAEKDKYYYEWKHLEANMINKIEEKRRLLRDKAVLQSLLEKKFPVTITKEELEKRWKE